MDFWKPAIIVINGEHRFRISLRQWDAIEGKLHIQFRSTDNPCSLFLHAKRGSRIQLLIPTNKAETVGECITLDNMCTFTLTAGIDFDHLEFEGEPACLATY